MFKLNEVVSNACDFVVAVTEFGDAVRDEAYGKHADTVKNMNNAIGVISWVQLIKDVRNKQYKKAALNQMTLSVVVLGHNFYYLKTTQQFLGR